MFNGQTKKYNYVFINNFICTSYVENKLPYDTNNVLPYIPWNLVDVS